MKISKELISGSIPTMVLSVIKNEDMYGYRIIKELGIRSEYTFSLKEGTLYPILHSFESEGYVESYWDASEGRKRKYYHITRKGLKHLSEKKQEFEDFSVSVSKVLNFANE